jgi:D-beta-D-heptose 7-phosphate kinase/D-beta-D-heptose 1-phosphate adenosyltransferase
MDTRRWVDALAGRRLVVLGDVMLDRYLWGRVERISPEAPVPVVEVERETYTLGGAANVAHNIAALGGAPRLVGVVGEDAAGERLRAELSARGLSDADLVLDPGRRTTVKTRIVAHQQHVVRADEEDRYPTGGAVTRRLVEAVERLLPEADALVVSDYGKGVIEPGVLVPAMGAALGLGLTVSVDPKENHFSFYKGATVITPNLAEAGLAYGRRLVDEATLVEAGHALRERLDLECALVTRGAEGMSLFLRDGRHVHLPTVAREVFDVTGAGDTVVAVLSQALAAGADLITAARLANHAAGEVIRHSGTAVVEPEALKLSLAGVSETEWAAS